MVVSGLLLLVFHCLFQGPSWSSLVYSYLYFTVYFRDHRGRLWSTVTCISLFILGTVVVVSGLLLLVFHCLFQGPSWLSLVYSYLYFTVYFRDRRGRLWSTFTCISLFILGTVVIVSGLQLLVFHCLFQGPSWSSLVYCYLYFTVYFRDRHGRLWSSVTCISLFILGTVVIVSGLLLLVFHCLFQGPSWSSLVYCYLYFTVYFRTVMVVSGLLLLVFHCLFQGPSWSSLVYCYLYFTVYFRDRRGRLWSIVTCISLFILGTVVVVSGLQLCTCISLFILGTVVIVSGLLLLVFHCLFQGPS